MSQHLRFGGVPFERVPLAALGGGVHGSAMGMAPATPHGSDAGSSGGLKPEASPSLPPAAPFVCLRSFSTCSGSAPYFRRISSSDTWVISGRATAYCANRLRTMMDSPLLPSVSLHRCSLWLSERAHQRLRCACLEGNTIVAPEMFTIFVLAVLGHWPIATSWWLGEME